MGEKKLLDIETARLEWKGWIQELLPHLKPLFKTLGKVDLNKNDPTNEICSSLASLLQRKIYLEDEDCGNLCADDIITKQIIIEKNGLMKFWGIIYWLHSPKDYLINKSGLDPFYMQLRLVDSQLEIERIACGDYEQTNINRIWWYDLDLDWIYDFEMRNEYTTTAKKQE